MPLWNDLPERPVQPIEIAAVIPPATVENLGQIRVWAKARDAVSATGTDVFALETENRVSLIRYDDVELGWDRVTSVRKQPNETGDGADETTVAEILDGLGVMGVTFGLIVLANEGEAIRYLVDDDGNTFNKTDHTTLYEQVRQADGKQVRFVVESPADSRAAAVSLKGESMEYERIVGMVGNHAIRTHPNCRSYSRQTVGRPDAFGDPNE